MRPLERCEICAGSGKIRGVFHVMECAACNGGGLVDAETHEALPYRDLVEQLRMRLTLVDQRLIEQLQLMSTSRIPVIHGPAGDQETAEGRAVPPAPPTVEYVGQKNKYHRGGGNWTGD